MRADIKKKQDGFVFHLNNRLTALTAEVADLKKQNADISAWADRQNGMVRYCYAICKNDGVKALADKHRRVGSANPFAQFAGSGQANTGDPFVEEGAGMGSGNEPGGYAAPAKGGLGGAGRPF